MGEILDKEMSLRSAYFVSEAIANKIWDAESRTSKKNRILYGVVKERFLRSIITNFSFIRDGEEYYARDYYGLDEDELNQDDLFLRLPQPFPEVSFPIGFALDVRDERVTDYFAKRNVIKL